MDGGRVGRGQVRWVVDEGGRRGATASNAAYGLAVVRRLSAAGGGAGVVVCGSLPTAEPMLLSVEAGAGGAASWGA